MKIIDLFEGMRPEHVSGEETSGAVEALEKALIDAKEKGTKLNYDSIDAMMQKVCKDHNLIGQKLHDDFVAKHHQWPDNWIKKQVSEDWQKVNKHDKTDGLSQKAVNTYRKEHPGSKLKTAVTTKPSKLKKGSKAANRRKSFCARMGGMKKHNASAKTKRDPDSPINKALRRWHCESIEEMAELIQLGEQYIANLSENITPKDIHKLADKKKVKWDNEPSFLKLTKQLTGKEHLDDLDQNELIKVKKHLDTIKENFADGKNPGRKGLAKRSGVNTKASVSSLRNTAKHSSGEKARMAHWLANMKAGKKKHSK